MLRLLTFLIAAVVSFMPAISFGDGEPSLAYLTFEVDRGAEVEFESYDWLIPNLLSSEMSRDSELIVVDREKIKSVIREHKLQGESGLTRSQRFRVGSLLGVRYVITGEVIPLATSRFRTIVKVYTTQEGELIGTASAEGSGSAGAWDIKANLAYELSLIVKKHWKKYQKEISHFSSSPDALELFYHGMEETLAGRPEMGIISFMAARELDPLFLVTYAWESRAYSLAGMPHHAAISRSKLPSNSLEATLLSSVSETQKEKVVAIIVAGELSGRLSRKEARLILEQEILRTEGFRVFEPAMLGNLAEEFDLYLSGEFERSKLPKYGEWLVADVVLSLNSSPKRELTLTAFNPSSAVALYKEPIKGGSSQQLKDVASRVLVSLKENIADRPEPILSQVAEKNSTLEKIPHNNELLRLAKFLNHIRADHNTLEARLQVYGIYASGINHLNLPEHAKVELERFFQELSPSMPDYDYWLFRGFFHYTRNKELLRHRERYRDLVRTELAKRSGPPTAAAFYQFALESSQERDWKRTVEYARISLRELQKIHDSNPEYPRPSVTYKPRVSEFCSAYWLLGDALDRLGRGAEAEKAFEQVVYWARQNPDRTIMVLSINLQRLRDGTVIYGGGGNPEDFISLASARNSSRRADDKELHWKAAHEEGKRLYEEWRTTGQSGELWEQWQRHFLTALKGYAKHLRGNPFQGKAPYGFSMTHPLQMLHPSWGSIITSEEYRSLTRELVSAQKEHYGMERLSLEQAAKLQRSTAFLYKTAKMSDDYIREMGELLDSPYSIELADETLIAIGEWNLEPDQYMEFYNRLRARTARELKDLPWKIVYQLARCYDSFGENANAEQAYQYLIDNPSVVDHVEADQIITSARFYLAKLYISEKRPDKAAPLLRRVVQDTAGTKSYPRESTGGYSMGTTIDRLASSLLESLHVPG